MRSLPGFGAAGCAVWLVLAGVGGAAPLTVSQCIERALASNPAVLATAARQEAADAATTEARSAWFPRVALGAAYGRTDNPPQAFMMSLNQRVLDMRSPAFDPNRPEDTDNLRWSVGVQYRLFDGTRGLQNEMALHGAEAAAWMRQAARNDLAHRVTEQYYSALLARTAVGVREESVRSLEESLRVANERFKAGAAVKTDVLNLEVKLAEAREALIRSRNGVQLAVAALNAVIGQEAVTAADLVEPVSGVPASPPEADVAAAESRPEYRAMSGMALAADAGKAAARRAYLPQVNAAGSWDLDTGDGREYEASYTVGVSLEWEVFDGFRRSGTSRRAIAQAVAAERDRADMLNRLRLDVRQAGLTVRDAAERLDVVRKGVESAEEALRTTRERYRQGAADITELVMTQTGLTTMRMSSAAAHYDYLTALSNVQRAMGRLAQ